MKQASKTSAPRARLRHLIDPVAAVATVVLVFGAAQLIAGALATGVTIDEPSNVDALASWLDNGAYFTHPLLEYVYGPAYEALAQGANVVAGNNSIGEVSRTAPAYDVRHLTVAALALLTAAAVSAAVWRLSGSWRFALWAAAGLLAVPAWMGHGFFNPKDIPAGCSYTLVTAALMLALPEWPGGRSSRHKLLIGAMLAGGVFIGAGTRLALWVPLIASGVTYLALRAGQRRLGGLGKDRDTDGIVLAGFASGFAAIAILFPKVAREPFTHLTQSVSDSADFPWIGMTLTAGELLSEHPPWWYLPTWIAAAVPLLLGAFALIGAVLGVRALVTARSTNDQESLWRRPELGILLVFQQVLFLPLPAMITGATMYDGVRQHLYVLPAIMILAGYGAWRFWAWTHSRSFERRWRAIAAGLLSAALLIPMVEQTLLFPYNYTYVNPVASVRGVNGNWETDYLFASIPEALSRTPSEATLQCAELVLGPEVPDLLPCYGDWYVPFTDRRGEDVADHWERDTSAVWAIGFKRAGNLVPPQCEEADNVTRWLRGEQVTMSYVLRCSP